MLSIQSWRIFKYNFCPLVYLIINDLPIFSLNLDGLGEVDLVSSLYLGATRTRLSQGYRLDSMH